MRKVEIRIFGRVQGVSFRYFTRKKAVELGITGYVMNMPDGSVKTVAFGEEENLDNFITELKKGPPAAKVIKLKISEIVSAKPSKEFKIKFY